MFHRDSLIRLAGALPVGDDSRRSILRILSASASMVPKGRRVYIYGNTYAFRDDLKRLGAKWDPGERAWWLSSAKATRHQDELERLLGLVSEPRATRKQVEYLRKLNIMANGFYDVDTFPKLSQAEAAKMIDTLKVEVDRIQQKRWKELDDWKRQQKNPHGPTTRRPTTRQIEYALTLSKRLERQGWDPVPTRKELENWSVQQVSDFIDRVKDF